MKVLKSRNIINLIFLSLISGACLAQNGFSTPKFPALSINTTQFSLLKLPTYSLEVKNYKQLFTVDRNQMPIFCKWELDIMDKTNFPIKFRLGDVQYVDQLELKNHH